MLNDFLELAEIMQGPQFWYGFFMCLFVFLIYACYLIVSRLMCYVLELAKALKAQRKSQEELEEREKK